VIDDWLIALRAPSTRAAAADALLHRCDWQVFGARWRLVEVETYVYSAAHPDPYVHQDPHQQRWRQWYLHRKGGTLKNGTFKGIDLTFGTEGVFCGLLIRGVETADGRVIDGPCNVVHALMAAAAVDHVAGLDACIHQNPEGLRLVESPQPRSQQVFSTERVGLGGDAAETSYRASRQRFLSEPQRIKKGRRLLLDALLADGWTVDAIRALTRSPRKTILARQAAQA
jgi:hypothetical protein